MSLQIPLKNSLEKITDKKPFPVKKCQVQLHRSIRSFGLASDCQIVVRPTLLTTGEIVLFFSYFFYNLQFEKLLLKIGVFLIQELSLLIAYNGKIMKNQFQK